jgi:hypothetical protein
VYVSNLRETNIMAQVTIYLDDAAERRVKAAARKSRVSVSRWVADVIENQTRTDWPPEIRQLAGAWPDFPDLRDGSPVAGTDRPRGTLARR